MRFVATSVKNESKGESILRSEEKFLQEGIACCSHSVFEFKIEAIVLFSDLSKRFCSTPDLFVKHSADYGPIIYTESNRGLRQSIGLRICLRVGHFK